MAEKERLVNFTLLGQNYSFYTGASEEEMSKILNLVRQLIEESGGVGQRGTIPVGKTAVMACLNMLWMEEKQFLLEVIQTKVCPVRTVLLSTIGFLWNLGTQLH